MFDFSPEKLLLIAAVALLLVGPKRLPAIGRSIGRWLGDLRRATGSIADEMKEGLAEPPGPDRPAGPSSVPPAAADPAPAPGPPPPAQAVAPAPQPPTAQGPPPAAPPPPAQP